VSIDDISVNPCWSKRFRMAGQQFSLLGCALPRLGCRAAQIGLLRAGFVRKVKFGAGRANRRFPVPETQLTFHPLA